MPARDVALAVLVAAIWGFTFVTTRIALDEFSPPQLAALRFLVAASPIVVLARPAVPWAVLLPIGLTLYTGQFLFQFFGIASGMPPGLASVVVQTQAFFTVLLAALALGERASPRQLAGLGLAGAGLLAIGATVGQGLTGIGLGLTLVSAVSWAVGNVLLKRVGPVDILPLVVWLSVIPPLPSLALSMVLDGPGDLVRALRGASPLGLACVLHLGLVATVLAYAIWAGLLRRHPAAAVAPFALLAPFVGAGASALVFGERFGAVRLAGMALVLLGLAATVLPRSPPPRIARSTRAR
jgi:O-acetylserine/cysteine efflux transporter